MLERAIEDTSSAAVAEPPHAVYRVGAATPGKMDRTQRTSKADPKHRATGKLGIDALWQRARKLGAASPAESSAIVRADRDAGRR